ncbi:hypothetical protein VIGAN_01419900 [Vigna angularis var. angularis]|uniref:Uncharacterized protein n=1 Tax=Vigna angularis var. angularis TaxID=157739 RepID=A0A0S3R6Q1_PHAAN|nr:hypothetical protein VIGAN_01419900 [Vigna angularis var. angularis]
MLLHWDLHDSRINTIDFNCQNPHIVATSSSMQLPAPGIWRYTNRNDLTALRTFTHKRSVQSAYFSPSGAWTTLLGFTVELTYFSFQSDWQMAFYIQSKMGLG